MAVGDKTCALTNAVLRRRVISKRPWRSRRALTDRGIKRTSSIPNLRSRGVAALIAAVLAVVAGACTATDSASSTTINHDAQLASSAIEIDLEITSILYVGCSITLDRWVERWSTLSNGELSAIEADNMPLDTWSKWADDQVKAIDSLQTRLLHLASAIDMEEISPYRSDANLSEFDILAASEAASLRQLSDTYVDNSDYMSNEAETWRGHNERLQDSIHNWNDHLFRLLSSDYTGAEIADVLDSIKFPLRNVSRDFIGNLRESSPNDSEITGRYYVAYSTLLGARTGKLANSLSALANAYSQLAAAYRTAADVLSEMSGGDLSFRSDRFHDSLYAQAAVSSALESAAITARGVGYVCRHEDSNR